MTINPMQSAHDAPRCKAQIETNGEALSCACGSRLSCLSVKKSIASSLSGDRNELEALLPRANLRRSQASGTPRSHQGSLSFRPELTCAPSRQGAPFWVSPPRTLGFHRCAPTHAHRAPALFALHVAHDVGAH